MKPDNKRMKMEGWFRSRWYLSSSLPQKIDL